MFKLLLIFTLFFSFLIIAATPDSPYKIEYKKLTYNAPQIAKKRFVLDNGIKVFIVEDSLLPVFDISATIRVGSILGEEGLSDLTADLMESGGTKSINPDSLDALLDYSAISLSSSASFYSSTVSVSSLKEKQSIALDIFYKVLSEPAFSKKKLKLLKSHYNEAIAQRFDSPKGALNIGYDYLLYGNNKLTSLITKKDIKKISRKKIIKFHKKYYNPENITIALSGRFKTKDIIKKLNKSIGRWKKSSLKETKFPIISKSFKPSNNIFIEKDISQAYLAMGFPIVKRPHPDYYSLDLMNWILGGASFTSRIGKKIREEEGLAYSVGSRLNCGYFNEGNFKVSLQTKSSTAAYAISLIYKEIEKFLTNGALKEELEAAKKTRIGSFPTMFKNGNAIASTFLYNDYHKRDDNHFDLYRNKINAITMDDITRVAKKYIDSKKFSIVIVGNYEACMKGYENHTAKLNDFGNFKKFSEKELEKLCTN